jgi:hypothetical protein
VNFRNIELNQPETIKIVKPFVDYMAMMGWKGYNIHGSQFQKGLPDYFFFNEAGDMKWVEFKICSHTGGVSITTAQRVRFAEMHAHGLPVYVVGDWDLRGNTRALKVHYLRVTRGKPNLDLVLSPRLHQYIPSGECKWEG